MYDDSGNDRLEAEEIGQLLREIATWAGVNNDAALTEAVNSVTTTVLDGSSDGLTRQQFVETVRANPALFMALTHNNFLTGGSGVLAKHQRERVSSGASSASSATPTPAAPEDTKLRGEITWTPAKTFWLNLNRFLVDNRRELVFLTFFYIVTALIFYERFYNYRVLRLHGGLRSIINRGVAVTR